MEKSLEDDSPAPSPVLCVVLYLRAESGLRSRPGGREPGEGPVRGWTECEGVPTLLEARVLGKGFRLKRRFKDQGTPPGQISRILFTNNL